MFRKRTKRQREYGESRHMWQLTRTVLAEENNTVAKPDLISICCGATCCKAFSVTSQLTLCQSSDAVSSFVFLLSNGEENFLAVSFCSGKGRPR